MAQKSRFWIVALILVFACACVTACASDESSGTAAADTDGDSVVGSWQVKTEEDSSGEDVTGSELTDDEVDITLDFRDDGTCTMVEGTNSLDGTFEQSGDTVTYDIGGGEQTATLSGDTLTLADGTVFQRG